MSIKTAGCLRRLRAALRRILVPALIGAPALGGTAVAWPATTNAVTPAAVPDSLILTQARLIELAEARAPQVLEAEARLAGARGRLTAARALALDNPHLEMIGGDPAGAGPRTDIEITVPLGPGFKRARRIGFARAEVEREVQYARDARRLAVGAALDSWYRLLHAQRQLGLAQRRVALAGQLRQSIEERFRSGDAARLDLIVADTELSRSISAASSVEQNVIMARATLAILLGIEGPSGWSVSGDLADRALFEAASSDSPPINRSDLDAASAALRAATAERSLSAAGVIPDLAFRLNYENSGGVSAWLPGVALTVPLFNRGQGQAAEARAREQFARLEVDRRRLAAMTEAAAAREAYQAAVNALRELDDRGLPDAGETDRMIEESYRAGKINLASMLLLRRETLDTRRDHLDRLLEAALRGVNLGLAAGLWP